MTKRTRRSIITATGVCASSVISGCISYDDPAVPNRDLSVGDISVEKTDEGGYHVEVAPRKSSLGPDDWGAFHNVTIQAYTENGHLICRTEVGILENDQDGKLEPVKFECGERPTIVAFSADESPCDEDTEIGYVYYRCNDGDCDWVSRERTCSEGLSPEI